MHLDTKLNTETLKNKIEELKSYAILYENTIAPNVIEKCSFIVEVGALTIGTDSTGKIITRNTDNPTQFSQRAVDKIITMCFKNCSGKKVIPKVYGRDEWYRSRLERVKESLELFEKMTS